MNQLQENGHLQTEHMTVTVSLTVCHPCKMSYPGKCTGIKNILLWNLFAFFSIIWYVKVMNSILSWGILLYSCNHISQGVRKWEIFAYLVKSAVWSWSSTFWCAIVDLVMFSLHFSRQIYIFLSEHALKIAETAKLIFMFIDEYRKGTVSAYLSWYQ